MAVRDWVATEFGAVRVVTEHVGGMSPGCATTLTTAGGEMIFVKAVGSELNAQTPTLFRQEMQILGHLDDVPYRPALLGGFDDGDWAALALEHVPGRYPDLNSESDFDAVAQTVKMQTAELTPMPEWVDVPSLAATADRWVTRWSQICEEPGRFLPSWANARIEDLHRRVTALPGQLPGTSLCHFDIRDDNLLIRPNGQAVILDWGMARRGPTWTDLVLLSTQKTSPRDAQICLNRWIPADAQHLVTDLLVAIAGSQAWNSKQPPRPALPTFAAFTREDAARLFAIARLRLSGPTR